METEEPAQNRVGAVALAARNIGLGVLVFVVIIAVKSAVSDDSVAIPVGSRCSIARATYGLKDLGKAYSDLEKAQKANDEFGLTELARRDVAVLLRADIPCLVIDTNFLDHFASYRQVRVLSEPYLGEALWVKKSDLAALGSK